MSGKFKTENIFKRILKGIGYSIIAEFMSMFLVLSMIAMNGMFGGSVIIKVIIGLCTLVLTLGLYFNWAFNAAKMDRDAVNYHKVPYDKYMPVKMAVGGPIISIVMYVVLVLSKIGVLPDMFNIFLLADLFTVPFVDSFTSARTIDVLSVWGLIGLGLLIISQCAAIAVTYIVTYKDIDIVKFMYKN
ncbi:MAG: hypothetical protein ACI4YB_00105 [Oscillospiraceae bacterium]